MNKERQEAYLNLIQSLLSFRHNKNKIQEILSVNLDLLDTDFLRVLEVVAEVKSESGQENIANWLRYLKNQLAERLNLKFEGSPQVEKRTSEEEDLKDYFQFLLEVLYATFKSNGDAKVIYPLLAANVDKLDNNLIKICRWSITTFEEEAEVAEFFVEIMGEFGTLIAQFPLGDKASNMEIAIACYETVIKMRDRQAFPQEWATTQINLSNAYRNRIIGDKAENIENAIAASKAALQVYNCQDFPQEWAKTQIGLGNSSLLRLKRNKAKNIEDAISAYKPALQVYTYQNYPYEWAALQSNLGGAYKGKAYLNTAVEDKIENAKKAIAAYENGLLVYTYQDYPYEWAKIQKNLGRLAYDTSFIEEQSINLERAIEAYENALKVMTFDIYPYDWAYTQRYLGLAYLNRIKEDKTDNLNLAIKAFNDVLKVMTFDVNPQEYAEVLSEIGITYQSTGRFSLAYDSFKSAITTIESLREEIVSGEESKRNQAEKWNIIYGCMVAVCLELNRIAEAIEYIERSKTRNLVEQILERDSKTIFSPEIATQLKKYRDEITTGQYQIQNGTVENPKSLTQHLQKLRQQRNELQNRYLRIGADFKFYSFQATVDERTAMIEWYLLEDKILAFIITKTLGVTVWQSQEKDREALRNSINQYLQNYYKQKEQWQNSLEEELKKLASILHIDEILAQIPKECDHLILIPHRFLHLFPLHALPISQNSENSRCLLDLFAGGVSYAPSCQILQQVQKRERPDFRSLFAIQNPTEDLFFTDLEVETILSYFPSHQLLVKKQATKAALSQATTQLKQANYLHFSCHGTFNLKTPQDSCLLLAGADENDELDLSKCLTLGDLFEKTFDFSQTRLVVLSACETGLIDFNNTSDEYIGLPSGFIYAGSSNVASSLWTVNDLSTTFLMIKFIQNLKDATDISVPLAMNQAQLWLRNATKQELQEWASKMPLDATRKRKIRGQINKMTEEKPFNSPYHWAAFTAIGK